MLRNNPWAMPGHARACRRLSLVPRPHSPGGARGVGTRLQAPMPVHGATQITNQIKFGENICGNSIETSLIAKKLGGELSRKPIL